MSHSHAGAYPCGSCYWVHLHLHLQLWNCSSSCSNYRNYRAMVDGRGVGVVGCHHGQGGLRHGKRWTNGNDEIAGSGCDPHRIHARLCCGGALGGRSRHGMRTRTRTEGTGDSGASSANDHYYNSHFGHEAAV